jgi:lysine biosynthesis protein LysW
MSVDIQLVCPSCNGNLDDIEPELLDVIECPYCGIELEVTDEDPVVLQVLENAENIEDDNFDDSPIREEEED